MSAERLSAQVVALAKERVASGLRFVQIIVHRNGRRHRAQRIQVLPGLWGQVIGPLDEYGDAHWLVDVKAADIVRHAAKVESNEGQEG